MSALKAAAQQALEALQAYGSHVPNCDHLVLLTSLPPQRKPCSCGLGANITALRAALADAYENEAWDAYDAALAEPVQAPHMYPLQSDRMRIDLVTGNVGIGTPSAEPVAWSHNLIDNIIIHRPADIDRHPDRWTPLYTAPPQRKPLTEEEIDALRLATGYAAGLERFTAITRAIERAHGIEE